MKKEKKNNFKLANSTLGRGIKTSTAFTLIELLAIIVILAIIAVITVPIILNVIDNAKKGSIKDSAYGYKDAINKYYVSKLYENQNLKLNGDYTITDKGELSDGTNVYEIPFTGTTPAGGNLTYENNILKDGCITMDEYKVTVINGEITTVEKGRCEEQQQVAYKCIRATELHKEMCTQTEPSSYCSGAGYTGKEIEYGRLGSGDELVSGDAFDCDVNGDGEYNPETERFYYVSDLYIGNNNETNEPEFDTNYAVLIYYNNTSVDSNGNIRPDNTSSSLIAYDSSSKNYNGPITAITFLPTTSDWGNISLLDTSRVILNKNGEGTTDNGANALPSFSYKKDGVSLAARLLTSQEVENVCGITAESNVKELDTCNYLLENTKYSNGSLGTYGYWLENPDPLRSNLAWTVFGYGRHLMNEYTSRTADYGVRPAIEVLKTDILK